MKRTLLILAGAAVVLTALIALAWWRPAAVRLGEPTLTPEKVRIGDPATVHLRVRLPWSATPAMAHVELPDGVQVVGEEWRRHGMGWGTWTWEVAVRLQAYSTGPFTDGSARIGGAEVSLPVPVIVAREDLAQASPEAAGQLSFSLWRRHLWRRWLWGGGTGVVLVAAAIVFWLFRRAANRPPPPPKPPWELALQDLQRLEADLPLAAEEFFVRVTDVVRRYIEAGFALPATEQTTPEFLRDLGRGDSELTGEHRELLRDFLQQGDLVKFAGADCSQDELQQALATARRFVGETARLLVARQATEAAA